MAETTHPPTCPPWCNTDHDARARHEQTEGIRECYSSIEEIPALTRTGPVSAEAIRLADMISGKVYPPEVRVGDQTMTAEAALALAEQLQQAVRLVSDDRAVPWWQTEPCPSWCFNPHAGEDHYEDRRHFGPPGDQVPEVVLSVHDPVERIGEAGLYYGPPTLSVELEQHVDSAVPHVRVGIGGAWPVLRMTVAEARSLAAGLTAVCDATVRQTDTVA